MKIARKYPGHAVCFLILPSFAERQWNLVPRWLGLWKIMSSLFLQWTANAARGRTWYSQLIPCIHV